MLRALTNHLMHRQQLQEQAYGPQLLQMLDYAACRAQEVLAGEGDRRDRSLIRIKLLTMCTEIERQLPAAR